MLEKNNDCPKCGGAGWLWWYELDNYDGPGLDGGSDDTQYPCRLCRPYEYDYDLEVPDESGYELPEKEVITPNTEEVRQGK